MLHKVVIRYMNGSIVKGTTSDFAPNKTTFTLSQDPPTAYRWSP